MTQNSIIDRIKVCAASSVVGKDYVILCTPILDRFNYVTVLKDFQHRTKNDRLLRGIPPLIDLEPDCEPLWLPCHGRDTSHPERSEPQFHQRLAELPPPPTTQMPRKKPKSYQPPLLFTA